MNQKAISKQQKVQRAASAARIARKALRGLFSLKQVDALSGQQRENYHTANGAVSAVVFLLTGSLR